MIVGLPRDRAESIATRLGRRAQIGEGARPRAPRGRATTQRSIFVRFALDFGNNPAAAGRGRDPSRLIARSPFRHRPFAVSSPTVCPSESLQAKRNRSEGNRPEKRHWRLLKPHK